MKSYTDEILRHVNQNDVGSVIRTIKDALGNLSQTNQLKQALITLRVDQHANTIFNYSFLSKSKELREILINNNLIPLSFYTRKNADGYSPLALAVGSGDYEYVESSLKKGANPNELSGNSSNRSLLELAAASNNLQMIKLLICYQADVVRYGKSCIFLLINNAYRFATHFHSENRSQAIRLLINKGAKVLEMVSSKDSLLDYARKKATNFNEISNEQITLLEQEVNNRVLLNQTIPLFFLATQKDKNCTFYGMPKELVEKISSITRNQNTM